MPLQIVDGLDGQVGIDGAGAVADEQGEVHHLARLAALDDERHLGAGLFSHQPVMHRGHGQQAGNRGISRIDAAIRENQQRVAGAHRVCGAVAQIVQRVLESVFAVLGSEERRKRGSKQIARRDAAQLLEIAIGQDRMRQLECMTIVWRLFQNVALGTDVADERHHQFFADGIDGRIGHLRKKLLEVVEQCLWTVAEAGQRHIGAH